MSAHTGTTVRKSTSGIVYGQSAILAVFALIAVVLWGRETGFSVFLGGMSCWVPTFIFVQVVFSRTHYSRSFPAFFMLAEMIRLLVSAALFAVTLEYFVSGVLPALLGFMGTIAAFWIACLVFLAGPYAEATRQMQEVIPA